MFPDDDHSFDQIKEGLTERPHIEEEWNEEAEPSMRREVRMEEAGPSRWNEAEEAAPFRRGEKRMEKAGKSRCRAERVDKAGPSC